MLPLCRSLQDLFGVQIWYKLIQYWARNDFLYHMALLGVRGLSPNSDQHQISPCNINAYSTPEVMRIKDMITQGEFPWYFRNLFLVLYFEGKYGDKIGEFALWYLRVKGLKFLTSWTKPWSRQSMDSWRWHGFELSDLKLWHWKIKRMAFFSQ